MKLWSMSRDLNFNVMFSQRGGFTIAHSEHELPRCRVGYMPFA